MNAVTNRVRREHVRRLSAKHGQERTTKVQQHEVAPRRFGISLMVEGEADFDEAVLTAAMLAATPGGTVQWEDASPSMVHLTAATDAALDPMIDVLRAAGAELSQYDAETMSYGAI